MDAHRLQIIQSSKERIQLVRQDLSVSEVQYSVGYTSKRREFWHMQNVCSHYFYVCVSDKTIHAEQTIRTHFGQGNLVLVLWPKSIQLAAMRVPAACGHYI